MAVPASHAELDPEHIRQCLAPVFSAAPSVAAAYLFGSVARGEAGPQSDIDIGIVFRAVREQERGRILSQISTEIGRALGVEAVDVVDLEAQGPIFRNRVVHLYDRIDERRLYEILTQHRRDIVELLVWWSLDPPHK